VAHRNPRANVRKRDVSISFPGSLDKFTASRFQHSSYLVENSASFDRVAIGAQRIDAVQAFSFH